MYSAFINHFLCQRHKDNKGLVSEAAHMVVGQ